MKYVSGFLFLALSSSAFGFDCSLPDTTNINECSKTYKARSMADIESYMTDYKVNESGVAKNLLIDFDVDSPSLNIKSPCTVRLKKNRSISSTGKVCIYGKNGLYINPYSTLAVKDLELYSDRKVAIRHHANITGDSLLMCSVHKKTSYFIQ